MRVVIVALCCGLLSCRRPDPAAAEVKTPVHAVIRVHQLERSAPCSETGLASVKCFFKSVRTGCVYLDVVPPESPEAAPAAASADVCSTGLPRHRVMLSTTPWPREDIELAGDAKGERLAYRQRGQPWSFVYLLAGEPLIQPERTLRAGPGLSRLFEDLDLGDPGAASPTSGPTLDWTKVPDLDAFAPTLLPTVRAGQQQALLDRIRLARGEDGLVELLLGTTSATALSIDDELWQPTFESLSEPQQTRVIAGVRKLFEASGAQMSQPALTWLIEHPEAQPADFDLLLVRLFLRTVDGASDNEGAAAILAELTRRAHPRVGELSCRVLEDEAVRHTVLGFSQEYPSDDDTSPLVAAAYRGLMAGGRAHPCRWVKAKLEASPCATDYRCDPRGQPQNEAELLGGSAGGDPEPALAGEHPLCSRAQIEAFLRRDAGEDEPEPSQALLLLGAAYAQNVVSADVLKRNARRLYRFDRPDAGSDAGEETTSPCLNLAPEPEVVACALPPDVDDARLNGCHLHIDDPHRTVKLDDLVPSLGDDHPD